MKVATTILQQLFKRSDGTAICMLACFVAVILFAAGSPQDAAASEPSAEPVYNVVSPIGESTVKMTTMAPRMDTLAGKTVCMVWNNAFKSDVTLPVIGEALKKQYPGVKIVPYTDMPNGFSAGTSRDSQETIRGPASALQRKRLQCSNQRERRLRHLHTACGARDSRGRAIRHSRRSGDQSRFR